MMAKCETFGKFPLFLTILASCFFDAFHGYRIGVGRADCTGPPVQVKFMGYSTPFQEGEGMHTRQYSRAFTVDDGMKRAVFVTFDGCLTAHQVKRDVVAKLQAKFGNQYTMDNVIISATHSHSTPGGYTTNLVYELMTFGFVQQSFDALVDGIYNSIVRAHENMRYGRIYIGETEVFGATINRSPTAYLQNPEKERSRYMYDTDKTMTQLRFVNEKNETIGAINWFAIHGTSLNKTNCLVSSDNIGYAALLLEKQMNPDDLPGRGTFVGTFAPTNLGDVSPNVKGPRCQHSGERCNLYTSTCPLLEGPCIASGPGKDHFESATIIGTRLFEAAWKMFQEQNGREVLGNINYKHKYVRMSSCETTYTNETTMRTENAELPYEWQPAIVPIQVVKFGNVILAAVPCEFTTMSGRRMRESLRNAMLEAGGGDVKVILATLANMYTSYVTTPDEYLVQRYEGASTAYGPYTLTVYIDQYKRLCNSMIKNESIASGPSPPNYDNKRIEITPKILFDRSPIFEAFGDVSRQPNGEYKVGGQVSVLFVSANPRNDLKHEKTYLTVEYKSGNGNWTIVATDSSWETKFKWKQTFLGSSTTEVIWDIPSTAQLGNYRIRHFGASRNILGTVKQFQGTSAVFTVR